MTTSGRVRLWQQMTQQQRAEDDGVEDDDLNDDDATAAKHRERQMEDVDYQGEDEEREEVEDEVDEDADMEADGEWYCFLANRSDSSSII